MAELSPEEIQLRANQVTDEVIVIGSHLGLHYLSAKITISSKNCQSRVVTLQAYT